MALIGRRSSALDTEATIRKFAARNIAASPSLSKVLFPTRMTSKKRCLRMAPSPARKINFVTAHRDLSLTICRIYRKLTASVDLYSIIRRLGRLFDAPGRPLNWVGREHQRGRVRARGRRPVSYSYPVGAPTLILAGWLEISQPLGRPALTLQFAVGEQPSGDSHRA